MPAHAERNGRRKCENCYSEVFYALLKNAILNGNQ
jgi:hypothetical protein